MPSTLERSFRYYWRILGDGLPEPVYEYRFHPVRKWRFDVAWPDQMCAIELQGGLWSGGAHVTPQGVQRDIEKGNAARALGWSVLYFSSSDLDNDPERCIAQVRALLEAA